MENQSFVDSVLREIIHPGVEQLMSGRFFSELRGRQIVSEETPGLRPAALSFQPRHQQRAGFLHGEKCQQPAGLQPIRGVCLLKSRPIPI